MTTRTVLRLPASVPGLLFGLATYSVSLIPASAQVTSPKGPYGILVNQWKDPNSNNVSALLGVLNFDGAGDVTGSYTLVSKNPTATGTLTGTYSGNQDGSNTVNLTFDVGGTITAAMVVTDGGTGLQLLVTGGSLPKPGQVLSGTGRIQSALGTMPAGTYGYLSNQWPDANNPPTGTFGVFNLDGAGNLTGSYTLVGVNTGPPISGTFMGNYSVNPDGTGSATYNLDVGITSKAAVVVVDGGAGILLLQTSSSSGGNSVTSGIARMQ